MVGNARSVFLVVMPVCVGLIILAVYFCHSQLMKWNIIEQG
jgi:hypothetical protein